MNSTRALKLSAPETDALLADLDASNDDLSARAAKIIRLMRAEHRRLHSDVSATNRRLLEAADALAFDDRPQTGEDWPNYTHRIQSRLRLARAAISGESA